MNRPQELKRDPIFRHVFAKAQRHDPTPGKDLATALASRAAIEWRKKKAEYTFVWKINPVPSEDGGDVYYHAFRNGELVATSRYGFLLPILDDPDRQRVIEYGDVLHDFR